MKMQDSVLVDRQVLLVIQNPAQLSVPLWYHNIKPYLSILLHTMNAFLILKFVKAWYVTNF